MEKPSFQFYPEAWLGDAALRACSSAARGLWADMLCLMHQGTPYGYLKLRDSNGGYFQPDVPALAKMTGNSPEEVAAWIAELDSVGVLGRTRSGTIYSKKMVRDERVRKKWRTRQAKSRSKAKGKNIINIPPRDVTGGVTPMSRGSPSSSSSPEEDLTKNRSGDPERSSQDGRSDLVPGKLVRELKREQIPDGVYWHEEDGIEITSDWKQYLRDYLQRYGKALDKYAPSSAGVVLNEIEYQKIIENLNGRIFTDSRLRPGPRSRPAKWKQFRALVRNEFVRALLRKREYHQKKAGVRGEPKSFDALRKSWEKLEDGK